MTNKEIWEKAKNAIIGWCNENKIPFKSVGSNLFPSYYSEVGEVIFLSLTSSNTEYPYVRFVIGTPDTSDGCFSYYKGYFCCDVYRYEPNEKYFDYSSATTNFSDDFIGNVFSDINNYFTRFDVDYPPLPAITDVIDDMDNKKLSDFFLNIDDSNELKITSSLMVEEFFKDNSRTSFYEEDYLNVLCRNTNTVLFKIQKLLKGDEKVFMFRVNIVTVDAELKIKQQFTTYEEFTNLINSTIQALKSFPSFEEYADELENYL